MLDDLGAGMMNLALDPLGSLFGMSLTNRSTIEAQTAAAILIDGGGISFNSLIDDSAGMDYTVSPRCDLQDTATDAAVPLPEPSSLLVLGLGLGIAALICVRRNRGARVRRGGGTAASASLRRPLRLQGIRLGTRVASRGPNRIERDPPLKAMRCAWRDAAPTGAERVGSVHHRTIDH